MTGQTQSGDLREIAAGFQCVQQFFESLFAFSNDENVSTALVDGLFRFERDVDSAVDDLPVEVEFLPQALDEHHSIAVIGRE